MASTRRHSGRAGSAALDQTVYPSEERVGEESLQRFIVELLRPLVEAWLASRGVVAFTGADQFVYYRAGDATQRVAPDLVVLPGVRPGRRIKSWKTWQDGVVPSLAIEVVSQDFDKDYIEAPPKYRELGVAELIIFDPDFEQGPERFCFQVFRQVKQRGLVRVLVTNDDRVTSKQLGCYLRVTGNGETARLRLATGVAGEELVPTAAEERDLERAEKHRERAEKHRERAGRLAAEAEVKRLTAQLKARASARSRRSR